MQYYGKMTEAGHNKEDYALLNLMSMILQHGTQ
jgi:hypothetical protein